MAEAADDSYDLMLLDVDNGPGYLVHETNAALYQPPFLTEARRLLRPGGVLVDLVGRPLPRARERLEQVFGNAETRPYDVRLQERDEQYWLHVARVPSTP